MAETTKPTVQSQFGRAAADYATSDVHAKGKILGRLVELSAPLSHWRVLDVATGAGHTAAAFAPYVAQVVASDITDEMLAEAEKLARKRNLSNMSVARAEAGALPFDDESFDVVCCRLAAHHFPDLEKFVREACRVLKLGGRFALVDNVAPDGSTLPNAATSELNDAAAAYNAFEKLRDPSHGYAPPPDTWFALLEQNGFRIASHEQFGKELDFKSWVERMRCSDDAIETLRGILVGEPSALKTFLTPRMDTSGDLHFTLQELVVVADKVH